MGPKAEVTAFIFDVCFTPNIGHSFDSSALLLRANKRHRSRMAAQSAGIVNYSRRAGQRTVSTPDLVPEGGKFIKAVYTYAALRTPHTHYNQNAQQA